MTRVPVALRKSVLAGGCGAKIGPGDLAEILKSLPLGDDSNLLAGGRTADDAGVYRLTGEMALVQTLDFFAPVVDDPYDFGRIAAANALSGVYAMGGRPLTAMNIVCFPIRTMEKAFLGAILRGGLEKIHEAGAVLVGGHSVEDPEIKYGLSVTGLVHPDKVLTNAGARAGDAVVLTKPIGTGILATVVKAGLASETAQKRAIETMAALNEKAAEIMSSYSVHACTDITGFGLLGHALEMAVASGVSIVLFPERVPALPDALDMIRTGMLPAGSYANRAYCSRWIRGFESVDPAVQDLLSDPQTSGGLLISLPEGEAPALVSGLTARGVPDAAIIGRVEGDHPGTIGLL